ncbi:hypothetical protein scyTo_0017580, partial [Scyliorhinus torazame]|nr:hypothetical protein [Scyliorhinus torazame]
VKRVNQVLQVKKDLRVPQVNLDKSGRLDYQDLWDQQARKVNKDLRVNVVKMLLVNQDRQALQDLSCCCTRDQKVCLVRPDFLALKDPKVTLVSLVFQE